MDRQAVDQQVSVASLVKRLAEAGHAPEADPQAESAPSMLRSALPGGAPSSTPISPIAVELIVAAEVSSRAVYERRLMHPIWPRGGSGVTIGIGYDVGTVHAATLQDDWTAELGPATVTRLTMACGVTGLATADLVPKLADVTVGWDAANAVFMRRSIPVFVGITERALPNAALLSQDCLGALVSLVYKRGPSFQRPDDRYREMRAIRDHMADRAFHLIPAELRAMKRLWQGDPDLAGLLIRREAEARLFEEGLAQLPAQSPVARSAGAVGPHPAKADVFPDLAQAQSGVFSWFGGWLKPVIEEPTRDQIVFQLPADPAIPDTDIVQDEHYVAIRLVSARIVNARRWTSLYHGAVHATCNMLYEGVGSDRIERQAVVAPDGFRDLDPRGQGKLLQIDRPMFGPLVYRGDMRLTVALFSVKSSDLAGPYLSLISELSQTASLGFLSAAQPFVAPLGKAADLLFGTSDAASLECGVVRGFETLRTGTWVCMGATPRDLPDTSGFRLRPNDNRLLDQEGDPIERFPYLVFRVVGLARRDNWMEIPGLKAAWDLITSALLANRDDDARAAAKAFRRVCVAGGDLTQGYAVRLADKADQKVAQTLGTANTGGIALSLRSLGLYSPGFPRA